MNYFVITNIRTLSELLDKSKEHKRPNTDYPFLAVHSALMKSERTEAARLVDYGVLNLVELENSEDETCWLYCNNESSINFNELMAIRYAMVNGYTLLTDNPVIASVAKKHGVNVATSYDVVMSLNSYKKLTSLKVSIKKSLVNQLSKAAVLL